MSGKGITDTYDVIIAGASFAGLAVASQLKGYRVLLLDRKPVGSGQTSACGTPFQVLRHWGAEEAVLARHDTLTLHVAGRAYPFSSPYSWCTFDYQRFCQILKEQSDAVFRQAAVRSFDGEVVYTTRGRFRARVFVDASGWRAVLANALESAYTRLPHLNQGLETIVPLNGEPAQKNALHFWYDHSALPGGVTWAFPRGETLSIGVGVYHQARPLKGALRAFAHDLAAEPDSLHGTYFPFRLRAPVVENVFVVGDAAGMCLGLTGEGIRPALYFGEACGRIIRRALEEGRSLEDALREYQCFVDHYRRVFEALTGAQKFLTRLPVSLIGAMARVLSHSSLSNWMLRTYWRWTARWDSPALQDG